MVPIFEQARLIEKAAGGYRRLGNFVKALEETEAYDIIRSKNPERIKTNHSSQLLARAQNYETMIPTNLCPVCLELPRDECQHCGGKGFLLADEVPKDERK
jgi:hypothetical protein